MNRRRPSVPASTCGVDVGGTKVLGVAIDAAGTVSAEVRLPTPHAAAGTIGGTAPEAATAPGAGAEVAGTVAQVVGALRRELGEPIDVPGAGGPPIVGLGIPGMVGGDGVPLLSPNLRGIVGADMVGLLTDRLPGATVVVGNDANCAALAELRLGAARGVSHALVVTLGTGIGGGLIQDGRLVAGAHGFAGEVGHMVVDPAGPPCPCGQRGCWERYASGDGLGRLAREAARAGRLGDVVARAGGLPEAVRGEHVARAATAGDAKAREVVAELAWWVALGLANLAAICDPERIVLGGGLAEMGDTLLAPTRRAFADLVVGGTARPEVPIVTAALGERAGAVGAALMAGAGGPA